MVQKLYVSQNQTESGQQTGVLVDQTGFSLGPIGSALKTNNMSFGSTSKPTYFQQPLGSEQ